MNLPSHLAVALLLSVAAAAPAQEPVTRDEGAARIERLLAAMGTGLRIEVEAEDRMEALRASEAAARAVEATEQRLSTWRPDSELSQLTSAGGAWIPLSPETLEDLTEARRWSRETGGLFDPCLGNLIAAWDLRGRGAIPPSPSLAAARASSGVAHLELQGERARLTSGARMDAGAFGKGAALRRAIGALEAAGVVRAKIDLGGQAAFHGEGEFTVDLSHPANRQLPVLRLHLAAGSLATSGNSERTWSAAGQEFGHLIDPRTGSPKRPEAGSYSATVFAPDALAADALSTACFLSPSECGPALALASAHLIVLRLQDGQLVAEVDPGLPGRIVVLDQGLTVVRRTAHGTKK